MSKTLQESAEELNRAGRALVDEVLRTLRVEPSAGRAALGRIWRRWTTIAVVIYVVMVVAFLVAWVVTS